MKLAKSLKKIKNSLDCLGCFLKDHSFICSMSLILLAFIGAALIYYFYVLNMVALTNEQPIEIKTELYKETLQLQKNRQENTQKELRQNYPDIFR